MQLVYLVHLVHLMHLAQHLVMYVPAVCTSNMLQANRVVDLFHRLL